MCNTFTEENSYEKSILHACDIKKFLCVCITNSLNSENALNRLCVGLLHTTLPLKQWYILSIGFPSMVEQCITG